MSVKVHDVAGSAGREKKRKLRNLSAGRTPATGKEGASQQAFDKSLTSNLWDTARGQ